jgi:DNA-binding SARP family transcriptional activator
MARSAAVAADMDRPLPVDIGLLGPLELRIDGRPVKLNGKQRSLLALLALNAGHVLASERIANALWASPLPTAFLARVRILVSELRKATIGHDLVRTQPPGYLLRAEDAHIDLDTFMASIARARDAASAGQAELAVARYEEALAIWRGAALGAVRGPFVDAEAARLEELRLKAVEDRAEQLLALGRHADLIPDLVHLTTKDPLRERPHLQLMVALHQGGRRNEALEVYRCLRHRLVHELGLEPGPDIQRLHRQLLTGDGPHAPTPPTIVTPAPLTQTRQLPADTRRFVGRGEELRQLDALSSGPDRLVLIVGVAGVGKTALAVRWAHRSAAHFPDGQIVLDMRGFDRATRMRPSEALSHLLLSLGVPAEKIPISLDAQVARYRSAIAGKRMLVVLDNVAEPDEVRPLLPGDPGCLVVVTSRDRLGGLVAMNDARRLTLDVLPPTKAVELLSLVAGRDPGQEDQEALAELARLCGHLPLALRIAAGRMADNPHHTARRHVTELATRGRLAQLRVDNDEQATVRTQFDLSYQTLPPRAQRMFRLLGLVPSPAGVTTGAAAALATAPLAEVEQLLDTLARVHLIKAVDADRFSCHDLLVEYAAELAATEDSAATRAEAIQRLLDFHLNATDRCAALTYAPMTGLPRLPLAPGVSPATIADAVQARDWMRREWDNVVAALTFAAAHGHHPMVWHLADALRGVMYQQATPPEWLSILETGLTAARKQQDQLGEAAMHYGLGIVHWRMGELQESVKEFRRALLRYRRAGWASGESQVLRTMGVSLADLGQMRQAIRAFSRAVAIDREIGNRFGERVNLINLGAAYDQLGDVAKASQSYLIGLPMLREVGHRNGEAVVLGNLGKLRHGQGYLDEAQDLLQQSLAVAREIGSRPQEASALVYLGGVHRDAGRYERATAVLLAGLEVNEQVGDRRLAVLAEAGLASVELRLGQESQAIGRLTAVQAAAEATGHQRGRVEVLLTLAEADCRLGQHQSGYDHAMRALELAKEWSNAVAAARARAALAVACLGLDDIDTCLNHGRHALRVQRRAGQRLAEARTMRTLAHAYQRAGRNAAARSYDGRAQLLFAEIEAPEAKELQCGRD